MRSFSNSKRFLSLIAAAVLLILICGTMTAFAAELTPSTLGDLNTDGKITAQDSLLIQRVVIGTAKLGNDCEKYADINKDGKVTNKDALLILRYTIGYRVNGLPYQKKDGEPEIGFIITTDEYWTNYDKYSKYGDSFIRIGITHKWEGFWHTWFSGHSDEWGNEDQKNELFDIVENHFPAPDREGQEGEEISEGFAVYFPIN